MKETGPHRDKRSREPSPSVNVFLRGRKNGLSATRRIGCFLPKTIRNACSQQRALQFVGLMPETRAIGQDQADRIR